MKIQFGSNWHKGNYYLYPAINLIVNKQRDRRLADNYQLHFNLINYHCYITFEFKH